MVDEKVFEQEVIEHARILREGEPDYNEDWEGWSRWGEACCFFMFLGTRRKDVINEAL